MTIKIGYIRSPEIPSVWDRILPWVQSVVDLTEGRSTIASTLHSLLTGDTLLGLAYDDETLDPVGFWIARIIQYPAVRMLNVDMLGGEDFIRWEAIMHEALAAFAKSNQCAGMELVGRKGWERQLNKFGWKNKFITCQLMFEDAN